MRSHPIAVLCLACCAIVPLLAQAPPITSNPIVAPVVKRGLAVEIRIVGTVVATAVAGPDGTYSAAFTVLSDYTVEGAGVTLLPGEYEVEVTSPSCPCGQGPGYASFMIIDIP